MKKLTGILLMLLAAQAVAVNYDREAVGNVDAGEGYYRYINNYSIKAKENAMQAWVLFDYQKEQADQASGNPYRSSRVLYSFVCAEKKFSTPKVILYKRDLAMGKPLSRSRSEGAYENIAPGSEQEAIFNKACKPGA